MMPTAWTPIEASIEEIRARFAAPLLALARGAVPAFVLRQIYPPAHCKALMYRFAARGLLYDPSQAGDGTPHRVDIGTSFGRHRADREEFFAHAGQTHALFSTLFEGYQDPVQTMYAALAGLAPDKKVMTARELDGRLYGPAIFRIYHESLGHGPHYDSVAKRARAFEYAAAHFEHQFAAVLCFQNASDTRAGGEPFLYNCPYTPQVEEVLSSHTFAPYVAQNEIERAQVHLEPGDLYFFFSENIHEVPPVQGEQPRAVLAIFFALSPEREEIFVWA